MTHSIFYKCYQENFPEVTFPEILISRYRVIFKAKIRNEGVVGKQMVQNSHRMGAIRAGTEEREEDRAKGGEMISRKIEHFMVMIKRCGERSG